MREEGQITQEVEVYSFEHMNIQKHKDRKLFTEWISSNFITEGSDGSMFRELLYVYI